MARKMPDLGVELKLMSASFEKGMKQANRSFARMNREAKKTSRAIGSVDKTFTRLARTLKMALAAFVGFMAIRKLGGILRGIANEMESVSLKASKLGMDVENFTALQYAAEQVGISMESLSKGIGKVQYAISDAVRGTGQAKDVFKELGLELDTLVNMKPEEQFFALAQAMGEVKNASDRTQMAIRIFGERQSELVNLMADGGQLMREYAQQAKDLGIAFGKDAANNVHRFYSALTLLKNYFTQFGQNMASAVATPLSQAMTAVVAFASSVGDKLGSAFVDLWNNAGAVLNDLLELLGVGGPKASDAFANGVTNFAQIALKAIQTVARAVNGLIQAMNLAVNGWKQMGLVAQNAWTTVKKWGSEAKAAVMGAFGKDTSAAKAKIEEYSIAIDANRQKMIENGKAADEMIRKAMDVDLAITDSTSKVYEFVRSQEEMSDRVYKASEGLNELSKGMDKLGKAGGGGGAKKGLKAIKKELDDLSKKMDEIMAKGFEDAFMGLFDALGNGAKDFGQTMKQIIQQILRQLFQVLVVQRLIKSFGGGGGFLGGIFGRSAGGIRAAHSRAVGAKGGVGSAAPVVSQSSNRPPVNVNVINNAKADVAVEEDPQGNIEIVISEVARSMKSGVLKTVLNTQYSLQRV